MSEQARRILKDVAIMAVFVAAMSSAYYMFAVAERYRALTAAYIVQSEQIAIILSQQAAREAPQAAATQEVEQENSAGAASP